VEELTLKGCYKKLNESEFLYYNYSNNIIENNIIQFKKIKSKKLNIDDEIKIFYSPKEKQEFIYIISDNCSIVKQFNKTNIIDYLESEELLKFTFVTQSNSKNKKDNLKLISDFEQIILNNDLSDKYRMAISILYSIFKFSSKDLEDKLNYYIKELKTYLNISNFTLINENQIRNCIFFDIKILNLVLPETLLKRLLACNDFVFFNISHNIFNILKINIIDELTIIYKFKEVCYA